MTRVLLQSLSKSDRESKAVTVNESPAAAIAGASEINDLPRGLIFLDKSVLFKQKKEFSSKAGMRLQ